MRKHKLAFTALVGVAALSSMAARPAATGADINDAIVAGYDGYDARTPSQNGSTTLGDAIQGGFYGNAANPRPSGHGTLPSKAPGPEVCDPSCDDTSRGSTWGNYKNADTTDDAWGGAGNPSNHRG